VRAEPVPLDPRVTRDPKIKDVDADLTIGRFGRLTGLSVHTLRHYDDVALLRPASVDASTGYRRYSADQVLIARQIHRLRLMGLPLEDIRMAIQGGLDEALERHQARLERQARLLTDQLRYTQRERKTNVKTTTRIACRPCQIKIAVSDMQAGMAFYAKVFDHEPQVTRRAGDEEYYGFTFEEAGPDGFFLVNLLAADEFDRPGASTIGLLVDDLDAAHKRTLDAGANEALRPESHEGMPRCSALRDPDGNWIWLYQA